MRLRCVVCGGEQDAEHLAVACAGCGARGAMRPVATTAGVQPGEPVCGPSRVPIRRPPVSELRAPEEEPLNVTRERAEAFQRLTREGAPVGVARTLSVREVPVQCGRCGGDDAACAVCRGRATVPTAALAAERAKKQKRRRPRTPPRVARVADPGAATT